MNISYIKSRIRGLEMAIPQPMSNEPPPEPTVDEILAVLDNENDPRKEIVLDGNPLSKKEM